MQTLDTDDSIAGRTGRPEPGPREIAMSLLESFEVVVLVAGIAILMWDNRLAARSRSSADAPIAERTPPVGRRVPR
jgi:hypothetical protein